MKTVYNPTAGKNEPFSVKINLYSTRYKNKGSLYYFYKEIYFVTLLFYETIKINNTPYV